MHRGMRHARLSMSMALVLGCVTGSAEAIDAGTDAYRPRDTGRDVGLDAGDAEYVDAASPLALSSTR